MTDERQAVECQDCEAVPQLYETPYADTDYVIACDCDLRAIDVSDDVNGNALMHPFSGKWSNIDYDHQHR